MIKIIKEGNSQLHTYNDIVYYATCSKCGCEFKYKAEDCAQYMAVDFNLYHGIKCLCCKNIIYLE